MGHFIASSDCGTVDALFLQAIDGRREQGLTQNQIIIATIALYKAIDNGDVKIPNPNSKEEVAEFNKKLDEMLSEAANMERANPQAIESEVQRMIAENRDKLIEAHAASNNGAAPGDLKQALMEYVVGKSVRTQGIGANLMAIFTGLPAVNAMSQAVDQQQMPAAPRQRSMTV